MFDGSGRFVGIALRDSGGQDRLLPASVLRRELGTLLGAITDEGTAQRAAVDSVYERALPLTLQVIAGP